MGGVTPGVGDGSTKKHTCCAACTATQAKSSGHDTWVSSASSRSSTTAGPTVRIGTYKPHSCSRCSPYPVTRCAHVLLLSQRLQDAVLRILDFTRVHTPAMTPHPVCPVALVEACVLHVLAGGGQWNFTNSQDLVNIHATVPQLCHFLCQSNVFAHCPRWPPACLRQCTGPYDVVGPDAHDAVELSYTISGRLYTCIHALSTPYLVWYTLVGNVPLNFGCVFQNITCNKHGVLSMSFTTKLTHSHGQCSKSAAGPAQLQLPLVANMEACA